MTLVRTVSRPAADPEELAWEPVYDAFVKRLVALDVGASAPRIGDPFPDFSLPDPRGVHRSLGDLVSEGPLVLSFNRGGWCPYCSHELAAWGEEASVLKAAGGRLVVVSGELGERASALKGMTGDDAVVLCDVDHGVALASGLAFHLSADLNALYLKAGLDLATIYGSGGTFLPIPATFVIDQDRVIRYAFVDPDFRYRASPHDVVRFLGAMG
ncbi:peroxiredoxin-like family protein [Brevundimonas sp.]|uniref:peroxiredoxin-like family protein n=1 Tax=Brevundimonas sp. TaxID=1871086 RepID=UPI003564E0CB